MQAATTVATSGIPPHACWQGGSQLRLQTSKQGWLHCRYALWAFRAQFDAPNAAVREAACPTTEAPSFSCCFYMGRG